MHYKLGRKLTGQEIKQGKITRREMDLPTGQQPALVNKAARSSISYYKQQTTVFYTGHEHADGPL